VLALPTLLISLDQSVLYLALPHLAEGLRPTGIQALWIMDIYGFMIAGFLITMGTLGDRIGRRRLLMVGAAAFGLVSLAAAYAPSAEALIVTRALLGVAAASLMPSTLALISTMFRDPRQRGRAVAVWASCFMGGTALGPVIGGILLEFFWWGSVFLLGVPVMVVLLILAPRLLPEYKDPAAGKLDLLSVLLSLVAILSLIQGIKSFVRYGFATVSVLAIVIAVVAGTIFLVRQTRLPDPLLDLQLFRVRGFTAALLILLVAMLGTGGGYLFITGFLQMVEGLSPMEAGLWMVPAALASILAAQLAPSVTHRYPANSVIGTGLLIGTVGYVALMFVNPVGGMPVLMGGFVLIFVCVGILGALGTNMVIGAAPTERGGSAAALSSMAGDLGTALGIAILGSLGSAVYRSTITLPDGVPPGTAAESLADAVTVAPTLPTHVADAMLASARDAYTNGLNSIGLACAVITTVSAVVAFTVLRERRPSPAS
jgi:DHA2 family multidrug resistance protein-like MFS transporter